jgi:hypothetical protein
MSGKRKISEAHRCGKAAAESVLVLPFKLAFSQLSQLFRPCVSSHRTACLPVISAARGVRFDTILMSLPSYLHWPFIGAQALRQPASTILYRSVIAVVSFRGMLAIGSKENR